MVSFDDFQKVDIRVGRVIEVEEFPLARVPSFIVKVDFGAEIGVKRSSAHLPQRYRKEALLNRLVLGVVNLPPRQIGRVRSEVLILGVPDTDGEAILVGPEREVPVGGKLF
jgi:tRNA-binding protein